MGGTPLIRRCGSQSRPWCSILLPLSQWHLRSQFMGPFIGLAIVRGGRYSLGLRGKSAPDPSPVAKEATRRKQNKRLLRIRCRERAESNRWRTECETWTAHSSGGVHHSRLFSIFHLRNPAWRRSCAQWRLRTPRKDMAERRVHCRADIYRPNRVCRQCLRHKQAERDDLHLDKSNQGHLLYGRPPRYWAWLHLHRCL